MPVRKAIVLVNIGTPKSYKIEDIKTYLDEFLMDPYVLQMPTFFRRILVSGITRIRPTRTVAKYKSIWTDQGSPLLLESNRFASDLQKMMPDYKIVVAMRYSEPSFLSVLQRLQDEKIEEIILAPMYPQYAESTTASSQAHFKNTLKKLNYTPRVQVLKPFFDEASFVDSWCEVYQETLKNKSVDFVLFSYHGLPERHIKRKNKSCLIDEKCCQQKDACEKNCYKAQCLETSRLLAQKMNLQEGKWSTSFQSRVGLTKWIGPSTIESVEKLAQSGTKKMAVMCPSFVVDGLETLEEINQEIRKHFLEHGGEEFIYIPCINNNKTWLAGFEKLVSSEFE